MEGRPREERELVLRAQGGDARAYEALVRANEEIAFRVAYVITRNAADAEDAAQEGFLKAWRALGRFRPDAPLRPWLLRIVANEARNRRRSAGRREHLALRVAERPADRLVVGIDGQIVASEEFYAMVVGVADVEEEGVGDAVAAGAALHVADIA